MSKFSDRCKKLFDYKNTALEWVDQETLPNFTDTQAFETWLSEHSEDLSYLDKPLNESIRCIHWALGEVDTSTTKLLKQRITEVQHECMFHLTAILDILEDTHNFKVEAPFALPESSSAPWPIDKFAQPDVMSIPVQKMISIDANMGHVEFSVQELWTISCCICATLLMVIYHKMELKLRTMRPTTRSF